VCSKPSQSRFPRRYVRHHGPDPVDAEHLALGVCESILDGELTQTIEDHEVIMRTAEGDAVTVALSDLHEYAGTLVAHADDQRRSTFTSGSLTLGA
jgi:hypothetical protein